MNNTYVNAAGVNTAGNPPPGQKEVEVPKAPVTHRLAQHGGMLAGAAFDGLKLASVNATSEILLDMARKTSKNNPMLEAALADPNGRQMVIAVMAVLVHEVALEFPGVVPKADFVALAARKQVTATSFILANNGMDKIKEMFAELVPHLAKLGDVGEEIAKSLPENTGAQGVQAHAMQEAGA